MIPIFLLHFLQGAGEGSKTLVIPLVSTSYHGTAQQVAQLGGQKVVWRSRHHAGLVMIFTRPAGAVMIFTRSRNAAASDNSMGKGWKLRVTTRCIA